MGVGVRLLSISTLEQARCELERIGVDPGGVARMTAKMLVRCVHLPALQCRQANILKQEMLSVGGDAAVARGTVACSIEATDCILIGSDKQIRTMARKLAGQPFGLPRIADELLELLDRAVSPARTWVTSRRTFKLDRPLIMGILNVTPDSFSDGGRYAARDQAVEHALRMIDEGADIIDIGGESTRPGAAGVSADEELQRVVPVIEELARRTRCALSIDTWKSAVAEQALATGAEIVNDISGLTFDSALAGVIASQRAGAVLMHTRGTPQDMQRDTAYHDLLGDVAAQLRSSLDTGAAAGIAPEQMVLDPGIGFAKDLDGNLELLRRLPELASLGRPLLVGTSRKSFIGAVLDRPADRRLAGTAATVALAVANGASILRVHDVAEMRDVALMAHAVASGRYGAS